MKDLAAKYFYAKDRVTKLGYGNEIRWQLSLSFENISEEQFLREIAWVILSTGMKEKIVRKLFNDISKCFFNWTSSEQIVHCKDACLNESLKYFNNERKILAIISAADMLNKKCFEDFKNEIFRDPIKILQEFPFIGPVTAYHLAKNIGLPYAKPDRHLMRITNAMGYSDVQEFCKEISNLTGDSIPVIDLVLWRFATINSDYVRFFIESDFTETPNI